MKSNQNTHISIEHLMRLEKLMLPVWLTQPDIWNTLDIDYHPPHVERLFLDHGNGYRVYLHVIHATTEPCLFHKHNWPAVLKQVDGAYEMGIAYSESEISSNEAHTLPVLARFIINKGTYYEMTQTDALHYVKPITPFSCSIMLTHSKYPEHVIRKESVTHPLEPLNALRKLEILKMFQRCLSEKE